MQAFVSIACSLAGMASCFCALIRAHRGMKPSAGLGWLCAGWLLIGLGVVLAVA